MLKVRANKDKHPTAAKCDVNVKLYGNKPKKLPKAINKKMLKMNEKYFRLSFPALFFSKLWINSYADSGID